MLIFAGGDMYRLLAAGTVASSYLMPYHFLILLPSMGRVKAGGALSCGLCLALSSGAGSCRPHPILLDNIRPLLGIALPHFGLVVSPQHKRSMALTTRRLALSILFASLFAMAMKPSLDTDSFWHLRAGAWMLDNARLLTIDLFSYTRFNQAWINHSWLSQILMAIIYRVGGYGGLNLATAFVIVLAFVFVYRAGEGGKYLRAFIIILAATTSAVYWSARPQILSLLFTSIFVYVLYDYLWRDVNRCVLLPPLMLLWVNLHGGFAIGFIVLVIVFVGELLRTSLRGAFFATKQSQSVTEIASQRTLAMTVWSHAVSPVRFVLLGMTNSKARWIGAIGLACAIAACINPYGAQMLFYPFRTVSIGVLQNFIQEWQSPNFHQPEAQVFIVMLLATVAAIGFSRRRLDLTDFLLFATLSLPCRFSPGATSPPSPSSSRRS